MRYFIIFLITFILVTLILFYNPYLGVYKDKMTIYYEFNESNYSWSYDISDNSIIGIILITILLTVIQSNRTITTVDSVRIELNCRTPSWRLESHLLRYHTPLPCQILGGRTQKSLGLVQQVFGIPSMSVSLKSRASGIIACPP